MFPPEEAYSQDRNPTFHTVNNMSEEDMEEWLKRDLKLFRRLRNENKVYVGES